MPWQTCSSCLLQDGQGKVSCVIGGDSTFEKGEVRASNKGEDQWSLLCYRRITQSWSDRQKVGRNKKGLLRSRYSSYRYVQYANLVSASRKKPKPTVDSSFGLQSLALQEFCLPISDHHSARGNWSTCSRYTSTEVQERRPVTVFWALKTLLRSRTFPDLCISVKLRCSDWEHST